MNIPGRISRQWHAWRNRPVAYSVVPDLPPIDGIIQSKLSASVASGLEVSDEVLAVEETTNDSPHAGTSSICILSTDSQMEKMEMNVNATSFVGQGNYRYETDLTWGRRKGGVPWFGVSQGVACDSKDRVYVFQRSPVACVLIFNRNGKLRDSWGFGRFKHPHGIWFNDEDEIFMTDRDTHLVTKWTADGRFLRSWGTANKPGAPGDPFNEPTKAFETDDGEMYVSDGYGQFRMHRYDKKGELVRSWGEKGTGPSQFALPHDVIVDSRDRVLACDRENDRVQIFNRAGDFQSEWTDMKRPMQLVEKENVLYIAQAAFAVSVLDMEGKSLSSWDYKSTTPRAENAPHSIAVDSRGDIYIGEVTGEDGLRKFVLQ